MSFAFPQAHHSPTVPRHHSLTSSSTAMRDLIQRPPWETTNLLQAVFDDSKLTLIWSKMQNCTCSLKLKSFSYQFVFRKAICWQLLLIVIQPCQFHLSVSNSMAAATQQLSSCHYLHIGIDRNQDLGINAASAPLHHFTLPSNVAAKPRSCDLCWVHSQRRQQEPPGEKTSERSEESFATCGWIVRSFVLLISSDKRRVCWLETFHASWSHTDLSQPPTLAVKDLFQILLFHAKPGTSLQNTLHSHHMTWRVWDLKSGQMLCCVWVFLEVPVSLWGFQTNDSWLMRTPVFLWLNSVSDNHSPSFALHSQPAPAAVVRRQGCDKSDGRTPKACAEEDWKISHFSTQVIGINDQQPVWASESLK